MHQWNFVDSALIGQFTLFGRSVQAVHHNRTVAKNLCCYFLKSMRVCKDLGLIVNGPGPLCEHLGLEPPQRLLPGIKLSVDV